MTDTTITGGAIGILVDSSAGNLDASLHNVTVKGAGTGIAARHGATTVSNSVISHNTGFGVPGDGGTISVEDCVLTSNGTAVQAQTGSTVRLAGSSIYDNSTVFGCGGGTLASAGNNRKSGNVGGGSACAPNATVTLQ